MKIRLLLRVILTISLSTWVINPPPLIAEKDKINDILTETKIETPKLGDKSKFTTQQKLTTLNTTNLTFTNASNIIVNTETSTFTVGGNGYNAYNVSLFQGFYLQINAFFPVNISVSQGDIDLDILYSNGTTWQTVV